MEQAFARSFLSNTDTRLRGHTGIPGIVATLLRRKRSEMTRETTHRADFTWSTQLSPRVRYEPSYKVGAGEKRQRPQTGDSRTEEAEIGLAGLYQARSGGNRAMIATAESFIVTNSALTSKGRSELVAPWLRDETRSFLSSKMPSKHEFPRVPAPGWRLAADRARERKDTIRRVQKDMDEHLESLVAKHETLREVARARDIFSHRDTLNDELLEVASFASGSSSEFSTKLSQLEENHGATIDALAHFDNDAAERVNALQDIANHLTL